jgi:hypothetical protein
MTVTNAPVIGDVTIFAEKISKKQTNKQKLQSLKRRIIVIYHDIAHVRRSDW